MGWGRWGAPFSLRVMPVGSSHLQPGSGPGLTPSSPHSAPALQALDWGLAGGRLPIPAPPESRPAAVPAGLAQPGAGAALGTAGPDALALRPEADRGPVRLQRPLILPLPQDPAGLQRPSVIAAAGLHRGRAGCLPARARGPCARLHGPGAPHRWGEAWWRRAASRGILSLPPHPILCCDSGPPRLPWGPGSPRVAAVFRSPLCSPHPPALWPFPFCLSARPAPWVPCKPEGGSAARRGESLTLPGAFSAGPLHPQRHVLWLLQ